MRILKFGVFCPRAIQVKTRFDHPTCWRPALADSKQLFSLMGSLQQRAVSANIWNAFPCQAVPALLLYARSCASGLAGLRCNWSRDFAFCCFFFFFLFLFLFWARCGLRSLHQIHVSKLCGASGDDWKSREAAKLPPCWSLEVWSFYRSGVWRVLPRGP